MLLIRIAYIFLLSVSRFENCKKNLLLSYIENSERDKLYEYTF